MTRLPRFFIQGQPHHIIQRGNNRTALFAGVEDLAFFLACLKPAAEKYGVAIHAYVLMTTHIHLLATPTTRQSLPKLMQSIGLRFAQYVNRRRPRTGALYEGRYRDTLIDSERYFLTCMRYIETNANRAGMVRRPEEYPWSSYRANALGQEDELVTPHAIYLGLGRTKADRESSYRGLFVTPLPDEDVEAIREATNAAWALGDKTFEVWVEANAGRRAAPRHRLRRHSQGPTVG